MKSRLKLTLIFLLVLLFFDSFSYSQKNTIIGYIDSFVNQIKFIDSNGSEIKIYAISGAKYDKIIFNRIVNGLKKYKSRKKYYTEILREISFQKDFKNIDALTTITNISDIQKIENSINIINQIIETADEFNLDKKEILKMLSKIKSLHFKKLKLNNYFKEFQRISKNITKTSSKFRNFSAALNALGTAISFADFSENAVKFYYEFNFIKSLQIDLAINRIESIIKFSKIQDNAFLEAARNVRQDLNNFPQNLWGNLYKTMQTHPEIVSDVTLSTTEISNSLYQLFSGPSPLSGWIGAVVFTVKTFEMIKQHQDDLREATLASNIYMSLKNSIHDITNNNNMAYAQYLFLKKTNSSLDNFYFWVLENFSKERKEVKEFFENQVSSFFNVYAQYKLLPLYKKLTQNLRIKKNLLLGFILDSSGSMKSNDPKNIRISAVKQIIDLLGGDEKIFLIDFDNKAKWINNSNWNNWDKNLLRAKLNTIDSDGGTDIGISLELMKNILNDKLEKGSKAAVILLTDGNGKYNNQALWFAKKNIPIYTISYKDKAASKLMNSIAQTTNGLYIKADDESDIISAFNQFYNGLLGNSKFYRYSDIIKQGQTIETNGFYIDNSTSITIGTLSYLGSKIGIKLTSPSGTEYLENGKNANWNIGANYAIVKISNPEGGLWGVKFFGINIPKYGEKFSFEMSGSVSNNIKLLNETKDNTDIILKFDYPNQNINLKKIIPKIIVKTPKNVMKDISNTYQNGAITYLPYEGKGNYQFFIEFIATDNNGNKIQRYYKRTIFIGDFIPFYIGKITDVIGGFVKAKLGKSSGNRTGIECYIYKKGNYKKNKIAKGYVTNVTDNTCTAEIQQYFSLKEIEVGDIFELDITHWLRDSK